MDSKRSRLKELLLKLSYEKKEITLASGRKSNFYFDGKQTSLHPEGAKLIGELFLEKIIQVFPDTQAIGGPTLGADPLVSSVSITSYLQNKNLPAFIIRKEPKKHGTQNWIEGEKNLQKGMKVLILEDVVTTGGSSLQAIEKIKSYDFDVLGILALVDREEGAQENIRNKGYRLESLFKKSELIQP